MRGQKKMSDQKDPKAADKSKDSEAAEEKPAHKDTPRGKTFSGRGTETKK
jgi:hypothetical protein